MVNAINTTYYNSYTSSVQQSPTVGDYSTVEDGVSSLNNKSEVQDSGVLNEHILESQNEIFAIQISTQNGITLINTTKAAVDDMQDIVARLKAKISSLSDSSTQAELIAAQEDIDELLEELYDTKNGAKYYGKLLFGEYSQKPARLGVDDNAAKDAEYIDSASFQDGFSSQENSTMKINTALSLGGFSVTIKTADHINSALGVTEAFEKDLLEFEKSLDMNKQTLTQNASAASEQMKKLISYKAEPDVSENMSVIKSIAELRSNLLSDVVSQVYGLDHNRLSQIMTGVWGL
ncbi:hypothetical protein IKA92_04650 [bacterium]|nr:hypothetical protein [bacterium]